MSGWQPEQYDPRQHEQRMAGGPQYPPPGYGQHPYGAQQPPVAPQRRRSWPRRHPVLSVLIGIVTLIVIGIAASAGSNPGSTGAGTAVADSSGTAASTPAATAVKPHTVATFTGSGIENTSRFTVTSTWKLSYSFDCSSFGSAGNFAVDEDGGSDFNGVSVDDLATSKTGSSWAYSDAGTHYLEIDSECDWHVTITDES